MTSDDLWAFLTYLLTYPNQILYYISLFSKIRFSITYLPTYLEIGHHMWTLPKAFFSWTFLFWWIRISNNFHHKFSGDSATSSTSSSREKLNGSSDRISNITTSIRKTLNPKKDLKQPASLPPVAASMTSSNPSLGKKVNPGYFKRIVNLTRFLW